MHLRIQSFYYLDHSFEPITFIFGHVGTTLVTLAVVWFFEVPEVRLRNNSNMREINLSLGPAGPVGITFVALAGILTELWPFEVKKKDDYVVISRTFEIDKWKYNF